MSSREKISEVCCRFDLPTTVSRMLSSNKAKNTMASIHLGEVLLLLSDPCSSTISKSQGNKHFNHLNHVVAISFGFDAVCCALSGLLPLSFQSHSQLAIRNSSHHSSLLCQENQKDPSSKTCIIPSNRRMQLDYPFNINRNWLINDPTSVADTSNQFKTTFSQS